MWGDFRRDEDRVRRAPSEGPTGWTVAVGVLLLVVGSGVMVLGFLVQYGDLNGPNDLRLSEHVAFLWVPGAIVALVGIALFAWGWWRKAHAD